MERSANHLPSHRHPPIQPHHYAPTNPSTAQPTIEHGIFLRHHARTVRSAVRLLGGVYRASVVVDAAAVVWRVTRTASRTLRNHQKIARHPVSDAHRMAVRTQSRQSRVKAQGFPYGALATRNPIQKYEIVGSKRKRNDAEALRPLTSNEPPRNTRGTLPAL